MTTREDPIWNAAWSWTLRRADGETWDKASQDELARWLAESAAHRQALAKAERVWQLTGLVPPLDLPDSEPEPGATP